MLCHCFILALLHDVCRAKKLSRKTDEVYVEKHFGIKSNHDAIPAAFPLCLQSKIGALQYLDLLLYLSLSFQKITTIDRFAAPVASLEYPVARSIHRVPSLLVQA